MKRWKFKTVTILTLCMSLGIAAASYGETRTTNNGTKIEGTWISDNQEGPGRIYYSDGQVFEGFWHKGKLEGTGISYETDGSKGIWFYYNDQTNGLGLRIKSGGEVDAGIWEDHKRKEDASLSYWKDSEGTRYYAKNKEDINDGKAIALYSNGRIYLGEFHNGKREGWGTLYYTNGDWHMGQWKNDMKNGAGYYSFNKDYDALYHMGIWKDDKQQGGDVQYGKDDNTLITNNKDDLAEGPSVLLHADGSAVFYEYKNNKISNNNPEIYTDHDGCRFIGGTDGKSGSGLRLMKSGSVYIGGFNDMKPEGYGFCFWPDSRNIFEGQWKNGKRTEGTIVFFSGGFYTGTFWDGEQNRMKTGDYRSFRRFETGTCSSEDSSLVTGTRITFNKDGSSSTTTLKDGIKQD